MYMAFSRAKHELHVISDTHSEKVYKEITDQLDIKTKNPKTEFMKYFEFEYK